MAQGRLTGELPGHATQEQIMHLATPTDAAPMEAL